MPEENDSTTNVNDLALPDLPIPGEGSDDLEMPLDLPDAAPAWMAALDPSLDEPEADVPLPDAPADRPGDVVEPAPATISSPRFDALKEQISSRLQALEVVTPADLELPASSSTDDRVDDAHSESLDEIPTQDPAWVTGSSPILEIPAQVDAPMAASQAESVLDLPSRTFEFQAPVPPAATSPFEATDPMPASLSVTVEEPATIEMGSVEPEQIADETPVVEVQAEAILEVTKPQDVVTENQIEAEDHNFEMPDTLPEVLADMADEPDTASGPSLEDLIADIDHQTATTPGASIKPQIRATQSEPTTARKRYVVFSLAGSKYAIPITNVIEMGRIPPITAVPYLPEWVRGVTNLRGDILSMIELRAFFGLPPLEQSGAGRMLVVRSQPRGLTTGLIVDGVHGMRELDTDSLKPVTAAIDDQILRFLSGLSVEEDGLLIVLDLESVLSSSELRIAHHA
ncbi:MAG: chemotaxis protein CheW [Acidobacteria bacterium]|nr:chemotaxis protein CheW [Acidobacteriota bacterium]